VVSVRSFVDYLRLSILRIDKSTQELLDGAEKGEIDASVIHATLHNAILASIVLEAVASLLDARKIALAGPVDYDKLQEIYGVPEVASAPAPSVDVRAVYTVPLDNGEAFIADADQSMLVKLPDEDAVHVIEHGIPARWGVIERRRSEEAYQELVGILEAGPKVSVWSVSGAEIVVKTLTQGDEMAPVYAALVLADLLDANNPEFIAELQMLRNTLDNVADTLFRINTRATKPARNVSESV